MKLDMPDVNKHQGKGRRQPAHDGSDAESKTPNATTKSKPKRDLSKVKCFNCGQRGHIASNCPDNRQTAQETETNGKQFSTWEDCQFEETDSKSGMYVTYKVYESVHTTPKFRKYDILLDNQADLSIVHPHLLQDVLPAESPITI